MLALWTALPLAAQSRNIRFQRISTEHGLSQSTINCIMQDAHGFMWFGTQDGLNRYDGLRFDTLVHAPDDPATLRNTWVLTLLEDSESNDLWVGTLTGGLSRWQRETGAFIHYRHDTQDPHSLADDEVWALAQDRDGTLWVGSGAAGLSHLTPAIGVLEHYSHQPGDPTSLSHDAVRALTVDREGELWVGTLGGLNRFDSQSKTFTRFLHNDADPSSLGDNRVRSVLEDRNGNLWVGTLDGLSRLDRWSGTFENFRHDPKDPSSLSGSRVRAIFEDHDGRIWVGTDRALDLFDPVSETFFHYAHNSADSNSLSGDRVMSIYQDRGGVLWVGTQGGINKWSPRAWSFSHFKSDPTRPTSLSGDKILSLSVDSYGAIWIGTNGQGLNRFERASGTVSHFQKGSGQPGNLSDDIVTALLHDRDGVLWAGTQEGGLNRLEPDSETFERFVHDPARADSLSADGVMSLYQDRDGKLWIGTYGGGLNRLIRPAVAARKAAAQFEVWRHEPEDTTSLSDDRVTALEEDPEGALWVGTFGAGLNRLDRDLGKFQRFAKDPNQRDSLSNDTVLTIHSSPTGDLWIGTASGLNRLENLDQATGSATFRSYRMADGLPNNYIYGIYSDPGSTERPTPKERSSLWLSTNRGLSRFDLRTETFKNYDTSHGLQADEFNMNAHFQSEAGELFFGGTGGFNAFFPDAIEPNTSMPPVVLTSFSKLNRQVELKYPILDNGAVALDHTDTIVSFEFAALDYTAPEKNRYRYLLEGLSSEWIDLGHHRRVSFTNLDPGSYQLRVQGANNDGVWSENDVSINISVAPPPWRTWWAYALYVVSLSTIVWTYVRLQHRRVERERAASDRLREVDKLKDELLAKLRVVVEEQRDQVQERERHLVEREGLIAELEAKNAELERFNYTVSHDLKSPLVTIKGFLGLLRRDAAAGDLDRLDHDVQRISAAADKMHTLLEELLELSRVGHQVGTSDEVSMRDVAFEALELAGGMIAESEAEIEIAPDLPQAIGDRVRLVEVYQNLITNALKYMGPQTEPRIEIGFDNNGSGRRFFVRDNGVGIDPRYHERIFGLFERLDADAEGTGIGLALVKRIIEMHGGSIWVESQGEGRGSTFYFTLASPSPDLKTISSRAMVRSETT